MARATKKQLRERWLTPEGKKVRKIVIDHIREKNWERFLVGFHFPFVKEIKNRRDLRFINLDKADLVGAALWDANLNGANLRGADLWDTNLSESCFKEANLNGANLMGADLYSANLRGARLNGATLLAADLVGADLREAELNGTNFMRADLGGIDLRGAKMNKALLQNCVMNKADLSKADLTGANIYGISAWDIKTDKKTIMKNLIISKDPLITVDDIEIAQFIYLVINNEKIRNVINIIRTKGVLILGSFYDDEKSKITPKKVLDKIKEILPKYNLIPIVFDFSNPEKQDLVSTVRTLALLSSFIIVDLSSPAGQLFELGALVQTTPIPFIPIVSTETKHITSMIQKKGLGNYNWFRQNYIRYSLKEYNKQIPGLIKKEIIPWAEKKNEELEEQRIVKKKKKD